MKKLFAVVVFCLGLAAPAISGDFGFVFDGMETNPEILYDFLPTYWALGVSYRGLEVVKGNVTELILIGRGGYGHTKLWTGYSGIPFHPGQVDVTAPQFIDLQSYNNVLAGADLRYQQFLNPAIPVRRGDLAVFAEYGISWMYPLENGTASYGLEGSDAAYPDRNGAVWNDLVLGGFLDAVEKSACPRGYRADLAVTFAPGFLANSLVGRTDFSWIEASFVTYIPMYERTRANGLNLFAIYLADRVAANLVLGDAVPQRVQKPVALGTLMRGFEKNTYGTSFTAVNNFEVRFAGPAVFKKNLYPRLHVFFDTGVYAGDYYNTEYSESGFLASAGFEAAFTIFDLLSLGYRGAFPLKGRNMEGTKYFDKIMIDLQF